MAFIWGDPLILYSTDANVIAKGGWSTSSFTGLNYLPTFSPFGYGAVEIDVGAGNGSYKKAFAAATGRVILQGRMYLENGGIASSFLYFYNGGGAALCLRFGVNMAQGIVVTNAAGVIVHTTASGVCAQGVWHYFAVDADIGNTSGIVRMWLDQPSSAATPLINLTAIDLDSGAGTGCDVVELLTTDNNVDVLFSDLACMDSSGAALNAYQGEKRWYVLPPTADGSAVGWTASAGSDYQCVDDTITTLSDEDTTYVQGAPGAGAELFTSAALPTGVGGIVYVGVRAEVRKTDGGVEPVTTLRITNGTTSDSAALALTQAYVHHQHGTPDNPGGAGWTKAQADAIEFGLVAT